MLDLKIAILGATSHIAKGLIANFLLKTDCQLFLFSRNSDRVNNFLSPFQASAGKLRYVIFSNYNNFFEHEYDVIINCVGTGTYTSLNGDYSQWFIVTETYDNLCIDYLFKKSQTIYFSLSSGAVYGKSYSEPANENTVNCLPVNHLKHTDYYAVARINAEAKHRTLKELRIIDLRIFSYFSRYINLSDGYFITEIIQAVLNNQVFETDNRNIIRDYLHPDDLFNAIKICVDSGKINTAYDLYSSQPVDKNSIIDFFTSEYQLKYLVNQAFEDLSATGAKNIYCSTYNKISETGFIPEYSAMDTIVNESKYIIQTAAKT